MLRSRRQRAKYNTRLLVRRSVAAVVACFILYTFAGPQHQPRTYSCGERVPMEEVLRGIRRLQASAHPENEPLVLLNEVDQRRKDHVRSLPPFIPYSLQWHPTDLLSGPMLFQRKFLTSSVVDQLVVLVDHNDRANGVYCSVGGPWDNTIRDHLSEKYTLRPLSQFSIRDRERLLYSPNVYRFLFVQHPLTRLHIMYRNATKAGLDSHAYRSFVSTVRGIPLGEGERVMQLLTPRFFITFLSRLPTLPVDFASQSQFCAFSTIKYHLAGHIESFASNIAQLNRRLSLGGGTFSEPSLLDKKSFEKEWADKRLRSHIAKLYADDFRNFEYEVSVPL